MNSVSLRNQAIRTLRAFFVNKNIVEVFSPMMLRSTAIEPFIDPVELLSPNHAFDTENFILPTSPEFPMKKMYAREIGNHAGIYEIAHTFRDDIISNLHYPSFTMVEWYLKDTSFMNLPEFVAELLSTLVEGTDIKLNPDITKIPVTGLCRQFVDSSYDPALPVTGFMDLYEAKCGKKFLSTGNDIADSTEIFSLLFEQFALGHIQKIPGVVALYGFPGFMAGLAEVNEKDESLRIECFLGGVEVSNGYQELSDPEEINRRFAENAIVRKALGKKNYESDPVLAELSVHLKNVAGMALGLERVLMKIFGISSIKEFRL